MFLVLGISLYTSRIILDVLGIMDFGIYNVVAGVTSLLLFFTSSLTNASQRFLSFEIGRNNYQEANNVFNLNIELYAIISVLIFIVFETVGLWIVNYKLVIPEERLFAANCVYQFTIITAIITILQVPYQSAIVAEEKMSIYAYVGLYNSIMKFFIVFALSLANDKLILYGMLYMLVELSCSIFYLLYCRAEFQECRLKYYWDRTKAIEIIRFISYTVYGCISWSLAYQGATIILNVFFGPIINAARGIAMQINGSINNFSSTIISAMKPAIIKAYSSNDIEYMKTLIIYSTKYTLLVFIVLSTPIVFNIDFVLSVWLKEVPHYTNTFASLIIIDSIIASLLQPIGIALNATGKIKNMQVYGRTITLAALPVSYVFYKYNIVESPNAIFVVLIVVEVLYFLYSFHDLNRNLSISYSHYFSKAIMPVVIVVLFVLVTVCALNNSSISGWKGFLFSSAVLEFVILFFSFICVLSKSERKIVVNFLKKYNK